MTLDVTQVSAFVLILARTTAWVMAAPVFSSRGLASVGRLALALALALFLAPAAASADLPSDVAPFILLVLGQVAIGLVLGWATGILLHAFEAAGTAIDLMSGLSIGTLIDPMSGVPASVFARFANVLFITLMVVTNAHHALITGFARSFSAFPVDRFPAFGGDGALAAAHAVTGLLLAALEIGAPVLGALFLTEVALGLASRFVPQANVFVVGMPVKILVTLLAVGSALVFLPTRLEGLLDAALRTGAGLLR